MNVCPTCGSPLERVKRPADSYLNQDQFDATRAGDYLCRTCPTYWWKNGVRSQETSNLLIALKAERKVAKNGFDVFAEIPGNARRKTYWWDSGSNYTDPVHKIEYIKSADPSWGWAVTENGQLNGWTKEPRPTEGWFTTEQECLAHAEARLRKLLASYQEQLASAQRCLETVIARSAEVQGGT